MVKVSAIVMITWLPIHGIAFIVEYCDPSASKKVMESI